MSGYFNTSPKPSFNNRQSIYDGYLSVEEHGKGGAVLWSYLAKPGHHDADPKPDPHGG